MPTAHPLTGVLQEYAWGGTDFLATLLGRPNPDQRPLAEYWLGAHPKGPARLPERGTTLPEYIAAAPREVLGEGVITRFGERLPFLLKVLDVGEMLSIQVHPTKAAAEAGFAREEAAGPPRDAPDRNYRDDNHKPELGVALTDFYLLHGFRPAAAIRDTLLAVPSWASLVPVLDGEGVSGLYRRVMAAPQEETDAWLGPLVEHVTRNKRRYHRDEPEFWVRRAAEQYGGDGHHDRGIFSIYWFNIVHLRPGEGIFQDAGIPHAYLEGACVELMANSDNVLRGGLTPKHIDVPELLEKTSCAGVAPAVLTPADRGDGWRRYPTPAPDFALATRSSPAGSALRVTATRGPAILLLLRGAVTGADGFALDAGRRAAFLPTGTELQLSVTEDADLYLAEVGNA